MIVVVDFGAGNTRSVLRALEAVGVPARLARTPSELAGAERLVLPGVGAAPSAVEALQQRGLWQPLREWGLAGRPLLGICLGAQLLLDSSEEGPAPGLGLLAGTCRRFPAVEAGGPRSVPHIGWNSVELRSGGVLEAYFVHGYWLDPAEQAVIAGTTELDGFVFPSLLRAGSVTATQFHLEKSGPAGRALLAAFAHGLLDAAAAPATARA
ncbi:MAG TPA: imidazole glycerol phosphate synthase subunit HisH [Candidatus Limnocylindria bacterium]|nr:imidazole glycerol phosphate synthase subunit HisH [Candidatus Limnocylindria bacterium]